jgi:hypothetical protein
MGTVASNGINCIATLQPLKERTIEWMHAQIIDFEAKDVRGRSVRCYKEMI